MPVWQPARQPRSDLGEADEPADRLNVDVRSARRGRLNLRYPATPSLSLHLDAENLSDAYCLESSYSNVWITPGAPRTVTLRMKLAP